MNKCVGTVRHHSVQCSVLHVSQHREGEIRKKIVVEHVQREVDKITSWQLDPVTSFANGIKMFKVYGRKTGPRGTQG